MLFFLSTHGLHVLNTYPTGGRVDFWAISSYISPFLQLVQVHRLAQESPVLPEKLKKKQKKKRKQIRGGGGY